MFIEGSLEVKLPTIWTHQRREEKKKENQKRKRVRRKKMQMRKKVGKPRNTAFLFQ
jgi:hypothetical protein